MRIWKFNVKLTKIKIISGIILVLIHWGLYKWGMKLGGNMFGNPVIWLDTFLIFPSALLIVPAYKVCEYIFHLFFLFPNGILDITYNIIFGVITSIYIFFIGLIIGIVVEAFLERKKR